MIVAITGGTGFIGRKLVSYHLEQGHTVRVLSRRSASEAGLPDSVSLHSGDLSTPGILPPFVDGADVLYHCAGEIRDQARMRQVHVEGTGNLIAAATGRIGRWVQLSSVGAYGQRRTGRVTEQTKLQPCGIYETSKVESDAMVAAAASSGAFGRVILRPSNVYGAGMTNQSLFSLIRMIQCGYFFFIGPPGASANYIHVDNVVAALALCATHPGANGLYNLSDYRPMEQFIATIADALGKPVPRIRLPEPVVRLAAKVFGIIPIFPLTEGRINALTGRSVYSIDKIESEIGYRHSVSMEAGLKEMVGFRQRRGS